MDSDNTTATGLSGAKNGLAQKIAAGQERNRARAAIQQVANEHPIALLAGGLLLGARAARLLPRNMFGRMGKSAAALAAMSAELATLYSAKVADAAGDAAREGKDKLEELGNTVGESAGEVRRRTSDFADLALSTARDLGGKAIRKVSDAAEKVRH